MHWCCWRNFVNWLYAFNIFVFLADIFALTHTHLRSQSLLRQALYVRSGGFSLSRSQLLSQSDVWLENRTRRNLQMKNEWNSFKQSSKAALSFYWIENKNVWCQNFILNFFWRLFTNISRQKLFLLREQMLEHTRCNSRKQQIFYRFLIAIK